MLNQRVKLVFKYTIIYTRDTFKGATCCVKSRVHIPIDDKLVYVKYIFLVLGVETMAIHDVTNLI